MMQYGMVPGGHADIAPVGHKGYKAGKGGTGECRHHEGQGGECRRRTGVRGVMSSLLVLGRIVDRLKTA